MDIEKLFYEWAATYGDARDDSDRCKYGKDLMIEFAAMIVKESDSLPTVSNSHFTDFCCYLTGHDEATVIQMYEDWKRYR